MEVVAKKKKTASKRVSRKMSLEKFLQWEQPEDHYKYEWIDGNLEKTEYMMKNTELFIVKNIQQQFEKTDAKKKGGLLAAETIVKLSETIVRIPDLAYFSEKQIVDAYKENAQPIPIFIIEIISPNEKGTKIERKALEYFEAGVQVIWQVYPELEMVKVLTSPKLVKVCFEKDVCSTRPAVPGLEITVKELFGVV